MTMQLAAARTMRCVVLLALLAVQAYGQAAVQQGQQEGCAMYEADGALFIETAAGQGDLIVDGTRVGGALRDLEAKVATCCAETAKLRLEHAREIAEEVCYPVPTCPPTPFPHLRTPFLER